MREESQKKRVPLPNTLFLMFFNPITFLFHLLWASLSRGYTGVFIFLSPTRVIGLQFIQSLFPLLVEFHRLFRQLARALALARVDYSISRVRSSPGPWGKERLRSKRKGLHDT